ncbi:DivIVA domain-containing protein [Xiamenia xianingshaonis]|uniref:Cell wall synthesis protein Wag31 n=1 Tax=Xiamenia xianingshaonis TaxID=2682776 RepID=A0A9E6MRS9_9ACTN|nr:DivIVA domain-containing protein [Xiamenia xianingshaonis]NGM18068.1 DivIVA domain-containing protein [Eggerthellaceae bacterium zg-893]NHM14824.1 DivIVA domain-containing protein [Xiamenia xianingshaonis]QTU84769.1 DivIVA domain-containing protein [Xiamenia xianingshaonis]
MAITSEDIHNQSFSIDRKGYDVDEVDVFLERVANEIDGLNDTIAYLQSRLEEAKYEGREQQAAPKPPSVDTKVIAEKDARIVDLERQLEAKKADDNAIAQALIIAQRSADEIIANANARAAATINESEEEGRRIVDKAENERKKVLAAIKKLEDDREDAREAYKDLLTDFIGDASRKLAEIGEAAPAAPVKPGHAYAAEPAKREEPYKSAAQAPIRPSSTASYSTPQVTGTVAAVTPVASKVEKDLSGFGDTEDAFEFEELD